MLEERDWGPREMLSHIAFARKFHCSYIEAIEGDRRPPLFTGTYRVQELSGQWTSSIVFRSLDCWLI